MASFSHAINLDGYPKSGKIRKLYYRIREAIDDWLCDHDIYWHWRLRDAYYYVYHRILQSHLIDAKLTKGHWTDVVYKMEAVLLEMVDGFVSRDGEDAFSVVYWDDGSEHEEAKFKMIEILYWKHVRKPALEAKKDALWEVYHKKYPLIFKKISSEEAKTKGLPEDCSEMVHATEEDPVKRDAEFKEIMTMEQFIEAENQRILHLCVDVRNFLWT